MGDAYHEGLSIEDVAKFVEGKKFVDLSGGGYVAKDKFAKVESELKELRESTKEFDKIKGEVETYRAKEKETKLKQTLKEAGVKDEFSDYLAFKVEKGEIVNDEKLLDNIKAYVKDKPQYVEVKGNPQPVKPNRVIETKIDVNGNAQPPKADNSGINAIIRGAAGKPNNP